ncbi:3938_t:CDS:10, partial [Dentiscutata erythropus]
MFSNGPPNMNTSENDDLSNLNNSESITKLSENTENLEGSTTNLIGIPHNTSNAFTEVVPVTSTTNECETLNLENSSSIKSKRAPYRRPISTANAQPPKKGILKPISQSNTRSIWKSDWFSTLNARIQSVANSATTSANPTSTASFFTNALKKLNTPTPLPFQEDLQKDKTPQIPQITITSSSDQVSQSNVQHPPALPNNNLLTTKSLKRVRFSVTKLRDEYPHSPIPSDSGSSDEEEEYDFREWDEKQNRDAQSKLEVDQKVIYTAKEMLQFYLSACRIREEFPLDRLVDLFKKANQPGGSLSVIDLTGHILDRKIAEPIADILTLEFGLEKLIMERCDIEDDTQKVFCHGLLVNDTVSHLNLSNNRRLRSNGFNYIAIYIKKSTTLNYLDLSGTYFDKKSATFLAQALIEGNNMSGAVLETLKLDGCGLKNNVLEVLGPGVRRSNLRYLSLRYNRINSSGAVWIGVMLRDYDTLNLRIDDEPLSPVHSEFDEQVEIQAETSRIRKSGLKILDVTGNDIRSGVQYISQALRRNKSLKELHLSENRIDFKGLIFIADGVKHNCHLELLDISRNPVGGPSIEGVTSLRNALSLNTTLKILFLSNTQLSTEGAIALAEYLPETKSLVHLDLTSNPDIDIAGVMALAVSIKMNYSVRILDVNVQPNDTEAAGLSRDILRTCVRNTEIAQNGLENIDSNFLISDFDTKPRPLPSPIPNYNGSSEIGIDIRLDDLDDDVRIAKEYFKVFDEMLSSEEQKSDSDNIESNEVIEQLHDQCQKFQAKIRSYITVVIEEELL